MATTVARPNSLPNIANGVTLTTAQSVDGDSDNILDRRALTGPADLVITYTDTGASQTTTINIMGSSDTSNWWNVPYALIATPTTYVVTAITFATGGGGTVHYLLAGGQPWRYLKLVQSATTATTVDAVVYPYAP